MKSDMDYIREQCAAIDRARVTLTCATCLHLSARDACCGLSGETARGRDPACEQHSDGRVHGKTKPGGGKKAGSDGRCPTCRQRNSRVREHKMDDGSVIVWHCNVPGCANHAYHPNNDGRV